MSTNIPDSPESLLTWLNKNILAAEHKIADRMAADPGTGKLYALGMKTKAHALRARAKVLFNPAICGIERTPDGFILHCTSTKAAEIIGYDYFVARPLPLPFYDETLLPRESRGEARQEHQEREATAKAKYPYIEDNMIRLEMGTPQALSHLRKALDLINNPVADAEEKPSMFPGTPLPWDVKGPRRKENEPHPMQRAADRPPIERRLPGAREVSPPTGEHRRSEDLDHPMRREWEVALLKILPKENEVVGSRKPERTHLLDRLRRRPTPSTNSPILP